MRNLTTLIILILAFPVFAQNNTINYTITEVSQGNYVIQNDSNSFDTIDVYVTGDRVRYNHRYDVFDSWTETFNSDGSSNIVSDFNVLESFTSRLQPDGSIITTNDFDPFDSYTTTRNTDGSLTTSSTFYPLGNVSSESNSSIYSNPFQQNSEPGAYENPQLGITDYTAINDGVQQGLALMNQIARNSKNNTRSKPRTPRVPKPPRVKKSKEQIKLNLGYTIGMYQSKTITDTYSFNSSATTHTLQIAYKLVSLENKIDFGPIFGVRIRSYSSSGSPLDDYFIGFYSEYSIDKELSAGLEFYNILGITDHDNIFDINNANHTAFVFRPNLKYYLKDNISIGIGYVTYLYSGDWMDTAGIDKINTGGITLGVKYGFD